MQIQNWNQEVLLVQKNQEQEVLLLHKEYQMAILQKQVLALFEPAAEEEHAEKKAVEPDAQPAAEEAEDDKKKPVAPDAKANEGIKAV